jgi:hypothetical protein
MKNAELFRRGEGPQISTLHRFDQTCGNDSIWDRLYNWDSAGHSQRQQLSIDRFIYFVLILFYYLYTLDRISIIEVKMLPKS